MLVGGQRARCNGSKVHVIIARDAVLGNLEPVLTLRRCDSSHLVLNCDALVHCLSARQRVTIGNGSRDALYTNIALVFTGLVQTSQAELFLKRRNALFLALLIAVLNLAAISPLPVYGRGVAAFLLFVPLLGFLATASVGMHRYSSWPEQALIALGAGYSVSVLLMLTLAYLPGGLQPWQTLAAFDALALLLLLLSLRHPSSAQNEDLIPTPTPADPAARRWAWLGAATIILVAAFLRLPSLSYSEFQDDEVSVIWHSAEVIQGRADALFVHDKGPAEILLTTATYSTLDRLNEAAARFPFAIAGIVGLLALYWLGWRLFGPLAGWGAAMLLALDGYFVGFARIVQYQSVVLLMVVLVVGIVLKYVQRPQTRPVYLYFAALFLATGVLAHYEAALALVPAGYLALVALRHKDSSLRRGWTLAPPVLLGLAVFTAFYAPFSLHPRFAQTLSEITGNRIGGGFPYNNLADFFTRSVIYSSTYYFAAMAAGLVAALALVYRRVLPRPAFVVATVVLIGGFVLTFALPEWLSIGGQDTIWLFFALALAPPLLAHKLSAEERAVWLWFAASMILALFFVQKPRTHVYNFFIPLALLVGHVAARTWQALDTRFGRGRALAVGLPVATALILLFGNYVYWIFTYHGAEVLRTWPDNRPPGYWMPFDTPQQNAMFGFPFKNGWKAVGALYAAGELDGPYARNGKRGVANWYTRGEGDCARDAQYYIFTPWNEPINKGLLAPPRRPTAEEGYRLLHIIQVNGEPRMEIYTRGEVPASAPAVHNIAEFEAAFDADLSSPLFEPDGPAAAPQIEHPLDYRFGESIVLKGYTLKNNHVRPGDRLDLTLYWQAQAALSESYKVFTQIIDMADYHKAGQRDGIPGCEKFPTDRWLPGDIIVDRYSIAIDPAAPAGEYTLLVGLYDAQEERLDVFAPDGQTLGDALGIDTVFVEP